VSPQLPGFTGRELYELGDDERTSTWSFSRCLSSFGLGLSLALPNRPVVILDGDGAALMRTGALPVIAPNKPSRMLHILLDNAATNPPGDNSPFPPASIGSHSPRGGLPVTEEARTADELATAVRVCRERRPGLQSYVRIPAGGSRESRPAQDQTYESGRAPCGILKKGN